MGDLDFKTFARALEPLLSEGKTLGVFASTLFEEITSYRDEDENPIHSTTQDTFRGYMNGRGISWLASKIAGHIDKEKFEIYIEGYGADTQDAIYRALSDYISGMTPVNIPESCASAFEEIILEAAAVKRGQVSKVLASSLTDDEYLIEESRGRCLNCGASLVASGDGSPVSNREKVRITPPAFDYKIIGKYRKSGILPEPNTLADLAMLCPACARDYRENPTREKFEALVKAKMRVHELFTTGLDVDICDLENHVREVVESLSSLSEADTSQDLQFDAHAVDEKNQRGLHPRISDKDERRRLLQVYRGDAQRHGRVGRAVLRDGRPPVPSLLPEGQQRLQRPSDDIRDDSRLGIQENRHR